MVQWKITDSSTGTPVDWTFPVNPVSFTHPPREASISDTQAVSPTGGAILFQGRDKVVRLSFEGLVNSETFYNELRTELGKWYPVVLTDDQGSSWSVVFEKSTFKRIKRVQNQWRYDYTVNAIVV